MIIKSKYQKKDIKIMRIFVHWHPYCTLLTTNSTATSKVILKISFKSYPFESILIYLNFLDVTKWIKISEEKKRFDFNSTILNRKKGENLNKTRYNHSLNVLHDQLHNTHQSLKLHVFESWCNKTRQRIQRLTLTSDQVSYIARQAFSCFNMNKV